MQLGYTGFEDDRDRRNFHSSRLNLNLSLKKDTSQKKKKR